MPRFYSVLTEPDPDAPPPPEPCGTCGHDPMERFGPVAATRSVLLRRDQFTDTERDAMRRRGEYAQSTPGWVRVGVMDAAEASRIEQISADLVDMVALAETERASRAAVEQTLHRARQPAPVGYLLPPRSPRGKPRFVQSLDALAAADVANARPVKMCGGDGLPIQAPVEFVVHDDFPF